MSKDAKLKALIDRKFLETLKEVAKIYGYDGDYIEISRFVEYLFVIGHVELPDMKPYDDIEAILQEVPVESREVTMEDVIADLKRCKTYIDFLLLIKNTFGLTLIWNKTESWLEYFGVKVPGTTRVRFGTEKEIQDLIFISGL